MPERDNLPVSSNANLTKKVIQEWIQRSNYRSVQIVENTQPKNDPNEDYDIMYEVEFVPKEVDQLQLLIWVTADGSLSGGLERYARLAKRTNCKMQTGRVALSFETTNIPEKAIPTFLDKVSQGKIGFRCFKLPIIGILNPKAVISKTDYDDLVKKGFKKSDDIQVLSELEFSKGSGLIKYKAWD